jgi:hypothetical protein
MTRAAAKRAAQAPARAARPRPRRRAAPLALRRRGRGSWARGRRRRLHGAGGSCGGGDSRLLRQPRVVRRRQGPRRAAHAPPRRRAARTAGVAARGRGARARTGKHTRRKQKRRGRAGHPPPAPRSASKTTRAREARTPEGRPAAACARTAATAAARRRRTRRRRASGRPGSGGERASEAVPPADDSSALWSPPGARGAGAHRARRCGRSGRASTVQAALRRAPLTVTAAGTSAPARIRGRRWPCLCPAARLTRAQGAGAPRSEAPARAARAVGRCIEQRGERVRTGAAAVSAWRRRSRVASCRVPAKKRRGMRVPRQGSTREQACAHLAAAAKR